MSPKKNILIIDDDTDILYMLKEICNYQGWDARTAVGYKDARKYLGKTAQPFDLILVDYHMPEMDGIAVVTELRKELATVPIIVLTVEERDSIVEKFLVAGASDYALKPIRAVDLISRIKAHLQYSERDAYYQNHTKGISKITLESVEGSLRMTEGFLSVEDIEEQTGIKLKTLYRYLQYLIKEGRVERQYIYQSSGRPKSMYKLKQ